MRSKAAALTVIVLIVGMVAYAWWTACSQAMLAKVEANLAVQLTESMGTQVHIGQLRSAGISSADIDDVIIFDKQGREMAAFKQVTIDYSLLSLLRGQSAIHALQKITLTKPMLTLIEDANGIWNVECLKTEAKPDAPEFSGKIVLKQAGIQIISPKGTWDFAEVDGQFTVKGSQTVDVTLTAKHNDYPISIQGMLNNSKNSLWLTIKADKLNPAAYQALLPANTELKFSDGLLKQLEITIARDSKGLRYAGKFGLDNTAAKISGVTVEQAQGEISFTNENLFILGGHGLVAGQPLHVFGKVGIAGDQPVFNLQVGSPGFDVTAVNDKLPFAGNIKFDAKVSGTPKAPRIAAKLSAAQGAIADYPLKAAKADLRFADNVVTVDQFSADMLGGQIKGKGNYNIADNNYQVQLAGENLEAASIRNLPVELSGRLQAVLSVSGQGDDWNSVQGVATVNLNAGSINNIPYNTLSTLVERRGSQTVVEYCNGAFSSGYIAASGIINNDQLAMKISGQEIQLNDIPYAAANEIAGAANFEGEITGALSSPLLALTYDITGMQAKQETLGNAAGKLTMNSQQLMLQETQVTDGTANHSVTGAILLTEADPALNLKVITHAARAETLVRLVKPEFKLTGNIENEMQLTGSLSNPTVTGKATLTQGSLYGQLIAKAEGTYERKNKSIIIRDFNVVSLGAAIKLNGTIAPDNSINFTVNAKDLRLSRLRLDFPYPVAGRVNISGQVTGMVDNPRLSGQLDAPTIFLNGREVKDVFSQFSYQEGCVDIPELHFSQETGNYMFAGEADLNTKELDGLLKVENGELPGILAIANIPDRGIRGLLNGEITFGGTFTNPNVILRGTISGGKIKNYLLDRIDVDAELVNKVITIHNFKGQQGSEGILVARGQADLNGAIDMEVGGRDIETGILPALFDTTIETKGKFSFNIQATGSTTDPNVAISLESREGSLANAEFDNLYGLFIYNQGSIHVNQLYLARGPYKASAYGIVPLKALNSKGRTKADDTDKMDLKLRLDNADLTILPMLTKQVAWATGPTTGEITIGGTLAQPTMNGQLTVAQGTIKLAELNEPIKNAGVDIRFEGDTININRFTGEMGGGSYKLSGSARLNGLALDNYNLSLALEKLGIKHKYFAGPVAGVVSLTSEHNKPHLSGTLTVDNATVNIPSVPESGDFAWDAGLDLELIIGNKVRLYNAYLYDMRAEGKIKFSGTLQKTRASGRVEALRGTVRYLTNRFTIERASAEFIQLHTIVPIIKLRANANFQQTRVNMEINGPATAMELKLTSEPARSQQEIISILTLRGGDFSKTNTQSGYDSGVGREQVISLLDAGFQMRFMTEIENTLQTSLGVDEFRLVKASVFNTYNYRIRDNKTYNEFKGYNLEIGKYLTDKILLSYTVSGYQDYNNVNLRYDLNKRTSLGATFGGINNGLFTIETRFNF